ncbi:MAG TPA: polyphosphate:AMP phosphotransferase [Methanospirillum sp.]|nr:polyphosphate:AMP phosphotransferase [Methanospirillum sp.]
MAAEERYMLETFDLSIKIPKDEYASIADPLSIGTGELQREVRKRGKSVIIVFEGWRGSGISQVINKLLHAFDPRGVRVYAIDEPDDIERDHSLMWRFWTKVPPYGQIAIFDRSWYTSMLVERVERLHEDEIPSHWISDIIGFEEQITGDGNLIIKFFLHISKQEQKKRLSDLEDDPFTYQARYLRRKEGIYQYNQFLPAIEKMLMKTDLPASPWIIVEAEQLKYAHVKILRTINSMIEGWLANFDEDSSDNSQFFAVQGVMKNIGETSILDTVDLSKSYTKDEYKPLLEQYQEDLKRIQFITYRQGIPVVIVFEGWDAAGKGGCIIRLTNPLNPRGYVVEPIGPPNDYEKLHHYLWRFYPKFPRKGHITIFDRSWYGRVLVERVEKFCREDEWQRAYHEINAMEEQLARNGVVIVKFWLHIDQDEQLKRFTERENSEYKKYKITDEDWRNRKRWDEYELAVNAMIRRTSTPEAPWTIIPANNKYYARIMTIKTVMEAIEKKIGENGLL